MRPGGRAQIPVALGALALAVAAAVLGVTALFGAGLVRWWVLPRSVVLARPVHLDYRQAAPSAVVPFLPADSTHLRGGDIRDEVPENLRILRPGQKFDVVVGLRVPPGPANADIFQVTARLMTSDRKPVFEASRPAMARPRGGLTGLAREGARAPWVLMGFASEDELLDITLVEGLQEDKLRPMALLELEVARRGSAPPPQIVEIEARVVLQLHWVVKAMYNYPLWSFLTTAVAVYCVLISSAAVAGVALGLFWLVSRSEDGLEGEWAAEPPAVGGAKAGGEGEETLNFSSLAQEETLHFSDEDEVDEEVALQDLVLQARAEEAAAAAAEAAAASAASAAVVGRGTPAQPQPPRPEAPLDPPPASSPRPELLEGGGGSSSFALGGAESGAGELRNRRSGRPETQEGYL